MANIAANPVVPSVIVFMYAYISRVAREPMRDTGKKHHIVCGLFGILHASHARACFLVKTDDLKGQRRAI